MAKSYPFESKNTGSASAPQWDRAITAQDERDFNRLTWTDGVFASPADGLMVTSAGGMKLSIRPGGAHIQGAKFWESNYRQITLSAASSTLPRIDRLVLRFDTAEDKRNIDIYLKEGVPATSPSPQDLIRQSNYWEIAIADIYIPKQATAISNSNITDRRLDPDTCGLVVPAIPYQNQTAALWQQIKDSIDLVNSALSGTVAGQLSNRLSNLHNENVTFSTTDSGSLPVSGGKLGDYLKKAYGLLKRFITAETKVNAISVYPVAFGTINGWRYIRYSNNYVTAAKTTTRSEVTNTWTAWGSVFYKSIAQINYPFTFAAIPDETITIHSEDSVAWGSPAPNTVAKSGVVVIYAPVQDSYTRNVKLTYKIEGMITT